MGHLLETVNPEAVDRYGGEPETLPDIGSRVVYIARQGEGRAGKREFPAEVMHIEADGKSLHLLVTYDVDDQVMRPNIRLFDENDPYGPAWRYVRGAEPEKFDPTRLNIIRRDLNALREEFAKLSEAIYGEYERPPGSLMEYLVKFEGKLGALGKAVKKG